MLVCCSAPSAATGPTGWADTISAHPQWIAQGPDLWVDSDTDARLVRWSADEHRLLRRLRARAETLSRTLNASVLGGLAANPGRVPELRTLLQLMDRA
jgi:hypothetical protein